jgi:mannosyltransferase OCH1-like enzyme
LRNRDLFDACGNTGYQADILRYELLEQCGGIYVDLDFECLRPLDPLVENTHAFIGAIAPKHRDLGAQTIETAILGSIPHLPFYSDLVQNLRGWLDCWAWHPSVAVRTGPQFFEKQLQRWYVVHGSVPLTVFAPEAFYPYLWDEPRQKSDAFAKSYAVHHWWGTWRGAASRPGVNRGAFIPSILL